MVYVVYRVPNYGSMGVCFCVSCPWRGGRSIYRREKRRREATRGGGEQIHAYGVSESDPSPFALHARVSDSDLKRKKLICTRVHTVLK
jgi:hypothetical protein